MGAYRCAKCEGDFCSHDVVPEEVDGALWCEVCYDDLMIEAEERKMRMKQMLKIVAIIIIGFFTFLGVLLLASRHSPAPQHLMSPTEYTFKDLLDAIEWVESRGNPNAMGPGGEVGAYQLKKIYVDDVNRVMYKKGKWPQTTMNFKNSRGVAFSDNTINVMNKNYGKLFKPPYSYDDRYNRERSRKMVATYIWYWERKSDHHNYSRRDSYNNCNSNCLEYNARIHNGGPNGWKKESTKPYWEKVKARMENPN